MTNQITDKVSPPPQDSSAAAAAAAVKLHPLPQSNKRNLHNSAYFKIRALARQLRPHFTEVLKTPDFRNCKAAHEIRLQMKLMVEFYKQMVAEKDQLETFVSENMLSAGENLLGEHFPSGQQEGKKSKPLQRKHSPEDSSQKENVSHCRESYVVGGGVFGWNFITFLGSEPVYYGVTKESFRRSHDK
ncbi:hypothetical protein LWI28_003891 [Acer negundo]|uniref:Uncharacterized protein n=1 Tax=Acer negundo TaxID=4023 RepID=A0AAD5NIH4_ACENE|nr:hypothetical protein LWI28_003891 [Acer negundo]